MLRQLVSGSGGPVSVSLSSGLTLPGATVTIREEAGALAFEIVADGPGRAAATDLTGAQDRVEALGGRLTVASEPGAGFRVSGSLPLQR